MRMFKQKLGDWQLAIKLQKTDRHEIGIVV